MEASSPGSLGKAIDTASTGALRQSTTYLTANHLIFIAHLSTILCTFLAIIYTTSFLIRVRHQAHTPHYGPTVITQTHRLIKYWVCYGIVSTLCLLLEGYLAAFGVGWLSVVTRGVVLAVLTVPFMLYGNIWSVLYLYRKVGEVIDVYKQDVESWVGHVKESWKELERELGRWAKGVLQWLAVGGMEGLRTGSGTGHGPGSVGSRRKRWRGESQSSSDNFGEMFGGDVRAKVRSMRERMQREENGGGPQYVTLKDRTLPKSRHEVIREARELMHRRRRHKRERSLGNSAVESKEDRGAVRTKQTTAAKEREIHRRRSLNEVVR